MEFDTMPNSTGADRQFVAPPPGRPSRRPRWANVRRVPPLLLLGAILVLAMAARPDTDDQRSQPNAQPVSHDAAGSATFGGTQQLNMNLAYGLRANAANQAALLKAGPAPDLPSGPLGIPGVALDAYKRAERALAKQEPNCQLPWWLLAGIGKVESDHADGGRVDSAGTTLTPIVGPALDGTNGNVALPAVNGGQWTGDTTWERAVGPMQFLPSNWPKWGGSGDPNNIYDASLAAGKYLCAGGRNLADPAARAEAVFSYNQSNDYV
ncbi:MAG: lytic transglycosylase, partial [Sciscionella sp.]|nr:lytic transglycosylase [Sciscionella sp.]